MSDDTNNTFRPQKKKESIDLSEITGSTNSTEVSLNDVLAIQRQAGVNIPQEAVPPSVQASPRPMEGISVTGTIPPAMKAMLQQRLSQVESDEDINPVPHRETMRSYNEAPMHQMNSQMNSSLQAGQLVTNDPQLNTLIGILNTQNYERVVLPSLGRFYTDADQPVGGELHIRPMTGQEETILSTVRFMRQGRGIENDFSKLYSGEKYQSRKITKYR